MATGRAREGREALTADELLAGDPADVTVVDDRWFVPVGEAGPVLHRLEGILSVPETVVEIGDARYRSYRRFPGFSVPFFTHDGLLVPAVRDLIIRDGSWSLILSPGRVWSEPGDGGMSRASFPFTLGSPPDRVGAGTAMLWLAQAYGEEVFDALVVDYLDVAADHGGWRDVTFGDVLDMATGVGDNAPAREPFDVYANESGANYRRFYLAPTAEEKLDAAYGSVDYEWGPGEVLRYTSAQTSVLSASMQAFLEAQEGPDARLWDRLAEEVLEPIGVRHLSMMHVASRDGGAPIPLMASGLRLTVDDLGKIVTLLQDGGVHDGVQLLHPGRLAEALARTGQVVGLPSGKTFADGDQGYHMSFWLFPHRTADGRRFQVPFMSGAGGNTVFLAPNGVSTFVFTDFGQDSYSLASPAVAEAIAPYPGEGVGAVRLIDGGLPVSTLGVLAVAGLIALLGIGFVVRARRASAPTSETREVRRTRASTP